MQLLLRLLEKCTFIHELILKKPLFAHSHSVYDSILISPVMVHAFSSPLNVVLSNIELALQSQTGTKKKLLKQAYLGAKRLDTLIKNTNKTNNCPINIKNSLSKIVAFVKIKYNIKVFSHYSHRNITLKGNVFLFEEAILCLLNNAAEAYSKSLKNKVIVVYSVIQNENIKIVVEDFGFGMNYLAAKVATLKGISYKKNGMGIGIPFARTIIEHHLKGHLEIVSSTNHGTRIIILLPLKI